VVGHAHADRPMTALLGRFAVDELQKSFVALAGAPAQRIPLVGTYLRERLAPNARPCELGPRNWAAAREQRPDGRLISAEGPPLAPLSPHFDFTLFNVAPPDQQVDAIRSDATVTLEGLLPGAPRRQVRLPGIEPVVFHVRGSAPVEEVRLRCDTLCIDADRALCTLTWRGLLPGVEVDDPSSRLVLTMKAPGLVVTWTNVRSLIALAERSRARVAADLRPGVAPAPPVVSVRFTESSATMPLASSAALPQMAERKGPLAAERTVQASSDRAAAPDLPFQEGAPPSLPAPGPASGPASARARLAEGNTLHASSDRPLSPTLPFPVEARPRAAEPSAQSRLLEGRTLVGGAGPPSGAELPFRAGAPAELPEPAPAPPRPQGRNDLERMTLALSPAAALAAALPFPAGAQPPPGPTSPPRSFEAPASPPIVPPLSVSAAPVEASVSAGSPAEVPPPEPPALPPARTILPLETYAAIQAETWEGLSSPREILERRGLDEGDWLAQEDHYKAALAREAAEGRGELAIELSRALRRAKSELGGGADRELPLADYARLRAEVDGTRDVDATLAAAGLGAPEWQRIHRRWQQRAADDPAVARDLRAKLSEARRALALRGAAPKR
jgi:hypothetical protein